jgi:hypothetical protein
MQPAGLSTPARVGVGEVAERHRLVVAEVAKTRAGIGFRRTRSTEPKPGTVHDGVLDRSQIRRYQLPPPLSCVKRPRVVKRSFNHRSTPSRACSTSPSNQPW